MVAIRQGEVWWAELPEPAGSGPEFRRPVVVVQGTPLNRSRLATVVCVPLTSNLVWADAPGNTLIPAKTADLPKDSVANASGYPLKAGQFKSFTRRMIEPKER